MPEPIPPLHPTSAPALPSDDATVFVRPGSALAHALPLDDDGATRRFVHSLDGSILPVDAGPVAAPAPDVAEAPPPANVGEPPVVLAFASVGYPTTGSLPKPGTLPSWSAGRETGTLPHGGLPVGASGADATAAGAVRQVGRYQVKGRLGRGGMATVYRAHDPSIGRDVAIKFLHASLCEDDECRMRFLREARAAGGLSHANIVVVHDVGEIDNRPYMAMELIDGAPLSDLLDKGGLLPVRDVVVMGLQLARALEYAHGRGIVHRDIKPGNIMLLADRQTIKVADFGIAHFDDGGNDQRTMIGAVMGTPQYMSPEQTRGDKVDGRSDLFSAGIVLYQMLAGDRPFRGESLVAVATKIATEDPPPLGQKRPDLPPALRRVVDRCLAKQPAQRYQSGRELADALVKVLGELDEAARESNRPRIVPLRVKWAATMGLIVALVMGLTAAIVAQRQYAAMMGQASDYGTSMARFIAQQNAVNVLDGDWVAVDVAVQEIMKTGNFDRISVVDLAGQVRASSDPALVNQPYTPAGVQLAADSRDGTSSSRYVHGGEDVLGFDAPVRFRDKLVGRVALGIPEKPLAQVARLSITLMVVLALVTVLAVVVASYVVANWLGRPIRLVRDSMAEIGKGRYDHRIGEQRNDEFGLLYQSFDAMALALQQQQQAPDQALADERPAAAAPHAGPEPTSTPRPAPSADPDAALDAAAALDAGAERTPAPPADERGSAP